MTDAPIQISQEDAILVIELNRAEKKNAITSDMYAALRNALEEADQNDDVRVILLRGKGGVFTAGNDLGDFNNRPKDGPSQGHRFLRVLQQVKKPIIAEVQGLAIGIGVTLLLHCDLVYADAETRFRLPFVNLGLCPEAGSTLLLPLKAGHRAASELLLLGDFFSAEQALQNGILNAVLPAEELNGFVKEQAKKLAAQNPQAVLETKRLLKERWDVPTAARIEQECEIFDRLLKSDASRAARAQTLK